MDYVKLATKAAEVLVANPEWTDQQIADSLNAETETRNRTSMSGSEVLQAIDGTEYAALSDTDKQYVWDLLHLGTLNPFGVEKTRMQTIFGVGSVTIAALAAARLEAVSWADNNGCTGLGAGHIVRVR